jgi:plasmid stabilization system protein ParE
MARYDLTGPAQQDLLEILGYLRQRSPKGARNVRRELREAMSLIASMPGIGHLREDLTSEPFRFWAVRSYLIVYRTPPEPVQILRVLHGARDVGSILRK